MADLRSHAAIFSQYGTDFKGYFPYFTNPNASYSVVRCESAGVAVPAIYFEAHWLWNIALTDGYYSGNILSSSFFPPPPLGGSRRDRGLGSGYFYGCAFVADPTYWDRTTRLSGTSQLRATGLHEVLFPSKKALHVNYVRYLAFRGIQGSGSQGIQAGFVDGHAVSSSPAIEQRAGCGGDRNFAVHRISLPPMVHTSDGVRGRDTP
jgi:hypothetical protein